MGRGNLQSPHPAPQHLRATDVVPAEPRHGEGRVPALSLKPRAAQTAGRSAEWDSRRLERCNGRVGAWMAAPALSLTEVAEDDQVGFCLRGCPGVGTRVFLGSVYDLAGRTGEATATGTSWLQRAPSGLQVPSPPATPSGWNRCLGSQSHSTRRSQIPPGSW